MKRLCCLFIFLCLPTVLFCDTNCVPASSRMPDRQPVSVPKLTYFVHQDDTGGSGSAFLLEDTNGVWLVSNVHVFSGSTNLTIINIEGKTIAVPTQVEVAKDRDMIRFLTKEPVGLWLSRSCEFEEPVCAYGDSGGAGVLTKLEGKAVAIGPDRIEISAEIIPGNSGGPVVNVDGEVVGVSSYLLRHQNLPDWIADGTRFADTRRMALRLNDVEWIPVGFADFYRQATVLKEIENALHAAITITVILSGDISNTIVIPTDHRGFQLWLKKHNRYAGNKSKRSALNNIKRLAKMVEDFETNSAANYEITIPFLKDKLSDMQEAYGATRRQLELLMK